MLPNMGHSTTFDESDSPTVSVVANNPSAQMISEAGSGLTLANFFAAGSAGGFEASGSCSLAVRTADGRTTVALSGPSRTQTVARVTLPSADGTTVVEADAGVRVFSTSPLTLEFELDGHGHPKRIVLGQRRITLPSPPGCPDHTRPTADARAGWETPVRTPVNRCFPSVRLRGR
ncbi:hypothetical protein FVO59_11715 [Microbacterium esteraromaticum]|uniref:Polysaccharide lyase family 8 C-terminal domain-containing protein n=1 Tax=Microbacterium esteraromaticum TaxID=57043 RepID=A0A7D7WBX3_9MICO|nr:polysaccharide lyase beta-sandwich domain-containing protein [Microbacterium esteraromaticum]QMU97798.1 hypothetical protein FVO59_11715 [Microbacterium esteraromaticum]